MLKTEINITMYVLLNIDRENGQKLDDHRAVKDYLILVPNGRSCPTMGEALSQAQRLTSSGLIFSCCLLGSKAYRTTRA